MTRTKNMCLLSCAVVPMALNWVDFKTLYDSLPGIRSQGEERPRASQNQGHTVKYVLIN